MSGVTDIIIGWMEGGYAYLTLLLLCVAVLLVGFLFLIWRFVQRMARDGVPLPFSSIVGSLIATFASFSDGAAWYLRNLFYVVALVALAIACWGFLFSIVSGDPLDFARSGALITLLALVNAFLSSSYAERVYQAIRSVESRAESDRPNIVMRAEGLSRKWSVGIVIVGTLIWGYGDLVFDAYSAWMCPRGRKLIGFECVAPPKVAPSKMPKPSAPQRFLIFFNWNASTISPDSNRVLWQVAKIAKEHPKAKIRVFAYADTAGSKKSDAEISVRRAQSVRAALVKLGISEEAIAIFPRGATNLVVPTRGDVRELQNRRVEIWVNE